MSRMKGTYRVQAHPLCTRIDVDLCPRSLFLQDDAGNEDTNVLFVLELIEWNLTHNLTQASFTDVLTILRERLPHYFPGDTLPKSFNAAISQFQAFGLPHKIVDICVNGCCRFDGSNAGCSTCPKCGADRWDEKMLAKPAKKRVGRTTFYYWDMKDLLRRMYAHPELAADMQAHAKHIPNEDDMQYMWGV